MNLSSKITWWTIISMFHSNYRNYKNLEGNFDCPMSLLFLDLSILDCFLKKMEYLFWRMYFSCSRSLVHHFSSKSFNWPVSINFNMHFDRSPMSKWNWFTWIYGYLNHLYRCVSTWQGSWKDIFWRCFQKWINFSSSTVRSIQFCNYPLL